MKLAGYADVEAETPSLSRAAERMALLKAIDAINIALADPADASALAAAVSVNGRLWCVFLSNVAVEQSDLPIQLRAQFISVGISALKMLDRARNGDIDALSTVVAISKSIAEGLE